MKNLSLNQAYKLERNFVKLEFAIDTIMNRYVKQTCLDLDELDEYNDPIYQSLISAIGHIDEARVHLFFG